MSQENNNIEAGQPTEEKKVNRLSSTEVTKAETFSFDKNVTEEEFNALFPTNVEGMRFNGQSTTNSLLADDNEPFEIWTDDIVTIAHKQQKVTVLTEGQKAFSSPTTGNKMAVHCLQKGIKTTANLLITPENKADVFQLIKSGKGKAITSNWGDKLLNKKGERIAKLEILPYSDKAPKGAVIEERAEAVK